MCAFRSLQSPAVSHSSAPLVHQQGSSRETDRSSLLLLHSAVHRDAVLLGNGGQLLEELGVQGDGKHAALGLWGNGGARRQDAKRRQRQSVLHRAIRKGRVEDDVAALRLEAL